MNKQARPQRIPSAASAVSTSLPGSSSEGSDGGNPRQERAGAGDGNRTRTTSLEGWSSTIELLPPGVAIGRLAGGRGRIRTSEGIRQLIYSQPPLAAWVPARAVLNYRDGSIGTSIYAARDPAMVGGVTGPLIESHDQVDPQKRRRDSWRQRSRRS